MRILYLHGLHSRPGGTKPTFLASLGHEVINPWLPDDDFEGSVAIAQEAFDRGAPDVVVGSSRGGAVALHLRAGAVPLVLIAPAWRRWGRAVEAPPGTIILHSRGDAVIPFDDSERLVADGRSALLPVGVDHNMIDADALGALADVLTRLGRDPERLK